MLRTRNRLTISLAVVSLLKERCTMLRSTCHGANSCSVSSARGLDINQKDVLSLKGVESAAKGMKQGHAPNPQRKSAPSAMVAIMHGTKAAPRDRTKSSG